MKTLTVVSPVYNEAEGIRNFYEALKHELKKLTEYQTKILFVADRSEDNTLVILKEIAGRDPSVQVLALSSRFGHQLSLRAGIDYADSDAVIMMDSDFQHPPELIPQMLAEYEKGHDVVYTVRTDSEGVLIIRKFASKLFYSFFNRLSDIKIFDGAADFRLLSRRVVNILKEQVHERNIFLRGLIPWMGFRQVSIRYVARPRKAGSSKYSLSRLLQFGISGIVAFSKKPLRVMLAFGFFLLFLSFIAVIVVVLSAIANGSFPSGWTTVGLLFAVVSGIQFIFLGIIGEYVGGILDEVRARPHYIVEEKINLS